MNPLLIINITDGVIQEMHSTDDFPETVNIAVVNHDTDAANPGDLHYDERLDSYINIWNGGDIGEAEKMDFFPEIQRIIGEGEWSITVPETPRFQPSPAPVPWWKAFADSKIKPVHVFACFYQTPGSGEESKVIMICSTLEISVQKSLEFVQDQEANGYIEPGWTHGPGNGVKEIENHYHFCAGDNIFLYIEPWPLDEGMA